VAHSQAPDQIQFVGVPDIVRADLRIALSHHSNRPPRKSLLVLLTFCIATSALGGIAGVPAGLAIFWRARRKLLWGFFGGAFIGAVIFEIYALIRLFSDDFSR